MPNNPFLTPSMEDTAAFADEYAQDMSRKEERYLKGYSGDDPLLVEGNKEQAAADDAVEVKIEQIEAAVTPSTEDVNPFLDKGVAEVAAEVETQVAEEIESNPFLVGVAEEQPQVTVDVQDAGQPRNVVESLEEIINDLESAMAATETPVESAEYQLDVQLDDESKEQFDQDLAGVIAQEPEALESLESIQLCNERSVPVLLGILQDKRTELLSK